MDRPQKYVINCHVLDVNGRPFEALLPFTDEELAQREKEQKDEKEKKR
jgi:hypothetical protein